MVSRHEPSPSATSDALFQFFAGHFHEDWPLDAATPDDVLDAFVAEHSRAECAVLAAHIDTFVASTPDDQALEHALFETLGCYYVPAADARSVRDWLSHVGRRLRGQDAC